MAQFANPRDEDLDEDLDEFEESEEILGGGSTLVNGTSTEEEGDRQEARQRDREPDDYDGGTDVDDDRVRGAGEQSLEELTITQEQGHGLEEHVGGLRQDRPEPNVNDPDPDSIPDPDAVGA